MHYLCGRAVRAMTMNIKLSSTVNTIFVAKVVVSNIFCKIINGFLLKPTDLSTKCMANYNDWNEKLHFESKCAHLFVVVT